MGDNIVMVDLPIPRHIQSNLIVNTEESSEFELQAQFFCDECEGEEFQIFYRICSMRNYLVAKCTSCGKEIVIYDANQHGYNGFVCKDNDEDDMDITDKEDETKTPIPAAIEYKNKHMITKTTVDEINEKGIYKGYTISPYDGISYMSLDDMLDKIDDLCKDKDKKYIYAYYGEPDYTMHKLGNDQEIVNNTDELKKCLRTNIPMIVFVKNGEVKDVHVGLIKKAELTQKIDALL